MSCCKKDIEIKFVKTHENSILPINKNNDSGYDVYAVESVTIPPKSNASVKIGLQLAFITEGYWIRIESRSGLLFNHGISSFNGIIDNLYRGEIGIMLHNHSDKEYIINVGDRVSQLVIYNLLQSNIEFTETIDETERSSNGFGSSGK